MAIQLSIFASVISVNCNVEQSFKDGVRFFATARLLEIALFHMQQLVLCLGNIFKMCRASFSS